MSIDTRRILAESVRSRHQALDRHPSLKRLVSAGISLPEYVRVLCLLQQCFAMIEPVVVKYKKSDLNHNILPYVCKVAAIDLDLQQLGADCKEASESIIPICIDTFGAYLGARYVLEGSAQGGLFIANCLEKSLPELGDSAFRFWMLQRQTAEQWPAFLAMLAQLDGDNPEQQRAIEAAIHSFDIFLAVFAKVSHGRSD